MLNRKRLFSILEALVSLLVIFLMILSWLGRDWLQEFFAGEIQVYGFLVAFIVGGLLEIIPQLISPHFILLNAAILGLPSLLSLIVVIAGSILGAFIGFELGRKYGFRWACSIYGKKKILKIEKAINAKGRWIVSLAAVSPLPYIPLIFGSLGMIRKHFWIYGVIPRVLGFIFVWILVITNIDIPFM